MNYNLVITLTNGVEHEFMIRISDGVDGESFQAKGSVATKKELPDVATAEIGDSYIVEGGPESEAGHLYILGTEKVSETATPHLAWIDMGRIVGRDGKDGTVADFDQNQFTTKVVDGKTVITIKNDPDSSNQLSVIGKEGLFVHPASAQVRAKDKSVRVAGIPQDKNGGFNTEVSVNAIPVKNNQLGIRTVGSTEGLYVQSAHEELLSPNKTLSIKTSATEVPFEPAKTDIDVAISKEDGNSLVIKEDGLFAAGGGGGDLDSKYIKIEEASEKKDDAVGGGDGTIVIGSGAGNGAMGPANKTTVVGALAKSLDDGGTVVGYNSSTTGKQGIAIGFETSAQGDNTISVGYQASASQRGGIGIGWKAQSLGDNAIVFGTNSQARGNSAIVIGKEIKADPDGTISIGTAASTSGNYGIAVGHAAKSVFNAIVIGPLAEATGGNSVLLGYGSKAGQGASAVGQSAQAAGETSIAVGQSAQASGKGAIAVGPGAKATHVGAMAFGAGSITAADDEVSFGNGSKRRKLTNVSDGENPYDAVNIRQLNERKLKREVTSGNFSWNYTDNKSASAAAGKIGTSCYVKLTMTMIGETPGNADIVPKVELEKVPCREDGTLIPYSMYVKYVTAYNNTTPKLGITVVMQEIPTHLLDMSSLEVKPVARADNGLGVGIPEIPVADDVFAVNELRYIVSYYTLS